MSPPADRAPYRSPRNRSIARRTARRARRAARCADYAARRLPRRQDRILAERATERFEGSREKVRALINAASTREDPRHVAIRAGDHGCQPLMTRLGVAATNRAGFDLYTVPEEIDRLVQGLHTVNTTPGMGRAQDDPSDGGTRG